MNSGQVDATMRSHKKLERKKNKKRKNRNIIIFKIKKNNLKFVWKHFRAVQIQVWFNHYTRGNDGDKIWCDLKKKKN